ncbi:MAG: helix-turn-helix transcriptional regulator [Gammaproteobacteria bacterium]|nr:helix-turn-helix transcriptional regulator [Gammaproteobacteria bacterium]
MDNRVVTPNGPLILAIRTAKGWSREKLAQKTGYCVGTHAKLEAGKAVFLNTLSVVAITYEVPVQELMVDDPCSPNVVPPGSMSACELLEAIHGLFVEHERAMRELIGQFFSSQDGWGDGK